MATTESEAEQVRDDKAEQRQIIRDLAARADIVYVAEALRDAKVGSETATFRRLSVLKGVDTSDGNLTVRLADQITVGCGKSADFTNPLVRVGKRYIIYVSNGELLRAGEDHRSWKEISWADELKIVATAVAPNTSLEQTGGG